MRKTFAMAVLAAATAMWTARQARREARMLLGLSDAELKDIGLTRSDVWRVHNAAADPLARRTAFYCDDVATAAASGSSSLIPRQTSKLVPYDCFALEPAIPPASGSIARLT